MTSTVGISRQEALVPCYYAMVRPVYKRIPKNIVAVSHCDALTKAKDKSPMGFLRLSLALALALSGSQLAAGSFADVTTCGRVQATRKNCTLVSDCASNGQAAFYPCYDAARPLPLTLPYNPWHSRLESVSDMIHKGGSLVHVPSNQWTMPLPHCESRVQSTMSLILAPYFSRCGTVAIYSKEQGQNMR